MNEKKLLCSIEQFQQMLDLLKGDEYRLLGPTIRNDVIMCDTIQSAQDLPIGWMDEQDPGRYRLKRRDDLAYFGYNLGPQSWKQFLFPPCEKLLSAEHNESTLVVSQEIKPAIEKMAFIGVRPCEIQAMSIQDILLASTSSINDAESSVLSSLSIAQEPFLPVFALRWERAQKPRKDTTSH